MIVKLELDFVPWTKLHHRLRLPKKSVLLGYIYMMKEMGLKARISRKQKKRARGWSWM